MTDNQKPAWAIALDIQAQRILDTVKTKESKDLELPDD